MFDLVTSSPWLCIQACQDPLCTNSLNIIPKLKINCLEHFTASLHTLPSLSATSPNKGLYPEVWPSFLLPPSGPQLTLHLGCLHQKLLTQREELCRKLLWSLGLQPLLTKLYVQNSTRSVYCEIACSKIPPWGKGFQDLAKRASRANRMYFK